MNRAFPEDFLFGTATSSIQIEGRTAGDGKGDSVWDAFCRRPETIKDGSDALKACNHIEMFREDVKLMKELGIRAYRFSIDWSRLFPEGVGEVNEAGSRFYGDLIDELIKNDIIPFVTLYHWELPEALQKKGGWLNEEIIEWFGAYAAYVAKTYGDRVKHFFTINEPQCFVGLGYVEGIHAPGLRLSVADSLQVSHNVLRAHGRAVQMIRKYAPDALVGIAPTSGMPYPHTESEADIEAARQSLFSIPDGNRWYWNVIWWSDAVMFGRYPEEALKKFEKDLPKITEEDMKLISEPIDFYGQNIYNGWEVRMGEDGKPETVERKAGFPRTANGWPVTPKCLRWGPRFLYERYKKPIYITENGLSCADVISLDGKVHDPGRIDYMRRYLRELSNAVKDGADIRGYFYWSLMDNFEWADGYSERFGLTYVDYETCERTPKDSAYWYRDLIEGKTEL